MELQLLCGLYSTEEQPPTVSLANDMWAMGVILVYLLAAFNAFGVDANNGDLMAQWNDDSDVRTKQVQPKRTRKRQASAGRSATAEPWSGLIFPLLVLDAANRTTSVTVFKMQIYSPERYLCKFMCQVHSFCQHVYQTRLELECACLVTGAL